jgi:hypothetical protein
MQARIPTQQLIDEIYNMIEWEKYSYPIIDIIGGEKLDDNLFNLDLGFNISSNDLVAKLYNHIILLREKIDFHHGIQSQLIALDSGVKVFFRYARQEAIVQTELDKKLMMANNYLRIFNAYLLAALVLGRLYHFDSPNFANLVWHTQKISTGIFYENLVLADDELMLRYLAEGKGDLVNLIHVFCQEISPLEIDSMLNEVKDWVALEQPSTAICTVIERNEHYFNKRIFILEEPCSQLLQEQIDLFNNLENQAWFNELTSLQQKLVVYYKENIVAGLCVMPSRLRGIVPLNKNAFKESVFIELSSHQFEMINSYYHTGTVAHVSHKDEKIAEHITSLNMRQQKLACHTQAMVMICLNSEMADYYIEWYEWMNSRAYVADDSAIIKLTRSAASHLENENIFYAKICLNLFRIFEYNDYGGINKLIEISNKNIEQLDPALPQVASLKDNILNIKKLCSIVDKDVVSVDKSYVFSRLSSLYGYCKNPYEIIDYNVKGIDILFLLTKIASLNNQLVEKFSDKNLERIAVWFGCASGENRTGISYYHNICASLIDYFEEQNNKTPISMQLKQQLFDMVAKTQHLHVMTGYQGNTFGTEGIRSKSSNSLKAYHPSSEIITKTSDIKNIPAYDASFNATLDRLNNAILSSEKNTSFKYLLSWVKEYFNYANQQRSNTFSLPEQLKNFYMNAAHALEGILVKPSQPKVLQPLLEAQKELALVSTQQQNQSVELAKLNKMFSGLVKEAGGIVDAQPSMQLTLYGFFNRNTATARENANNTDLEKTGVACNDDRQMTIYIKPK